LVAETNNKYYNQYLDIPNNDSRHNSLMWLYGRFTSFLAMISGTHYFTVTKKWFSHTLRFLHFSDHMNQPDNNDNNHETPCKIKTLFDHLNDVYATFYNPSEHSCGWSYCIL
jgi:hypothetical protein